MDFQAIATFSLMVLLLTIMPGPNGTLLLKTVPQKGRRAGILNLTGIVFAFFIHGIFSILGLSAFILSTSHAFFTIKLLGSIYLLYLGLTSLWQAFFSKNSNATIRRETTKTVTIQNKRLFLEGFITNLLNPKVSMFYLAAFPQFISLNENPIFDSFILVGIHSLVVVIWFSIIIIALGKAARAVTSLKFKKLVQGATGVLMLWFGYRLLIYNQKS